MIDRGGPAFGIAPEIVGAPRRDLGRSHGAAKAMARWTMASARTAKNWLGRRHVPSGEYLVTSVRHSDEVLIAGPVLAYRRELAATGAILGLRERLRVIVDALDGFADARGGPRT